MGDGRRACADGGSGDPSPTTAVGVVAGIRAALRRLTAIPRPAGRRVAVQGTGHVGANVVRLLVAAGAEVRRRRPATRGRRRRWRRRSASTVVGVDGDPVRASATSVARARSARCSRPTRSRGCAAARSPAPPTTSSARSTTATRSHARGIALRARLRRQRRRHHQHRRRVRRLRRRAPARAHARHRADASAACFALARERGISPARAAEALARERIAALAPLASRWRPGARTAWTQGRGLLHEAARHVIPLRDNVPTLRRPVVTTWLIIVVNVAVFVFSIAQPDRTLPPLRRRRHASRISGFDAITLGVRLHAVRGGRRSCDRPELRRDAARRLATTSTTSARCASHRAPCWLTLLTAMFMHGGWLHLIGNMLFLFVFGNNVEDAMGRGAFLLFYLLGGLAASLTQFAIDTSLRGAEHRRQRRDRRRARRLRPAAPARPRADGRSRCSCSSTWRSCRPCWCC